MLIFGHFNEGVTVKFGSCFEGTLSKMEELGVYCWNSQRLHKKH